MNLDILLGKTKEHLLPFLETKFLVHKDMIGDFLKLKKEAEKTGHNLQIISAFRDYERQLLIWNSKARGERALLDDHGNPLLVNDLSPTEIMFAILRWSALPGCSRHHWGTDIDVYDANTQSPGEVKLVSSECEDNGPAAALHEWLDSVISQKASFGFYRPYQTDRGGVSPEKWHLSYAPLAEKYLALFTSTIFKKNLEESDILLKEELLSHAEEIYHRFLTNVDLP